MGSKRSRVFKAATKKGRSPTTDSTAGGLVDLHLGVIAVSPDTARFFELMLIPLTEKPSTRKQLTDLLKFQEGISCLNRFWFLVVRFLLVAFFTGAAPTAQANENDEVRVLFDLESKMAQAWVQRDARTLERILADDYTLAGTGEALVGKGECLAGIVNPEFRTTAAIVADLRIRVYGDAAVVTGRATYRGSSKERGRYVRRFRFTDTFVRQGSTWKCVATHASGLAPE
jgi:ketosteroid isomerase-like protein